MAINEDIRFYLPSDPYYYEVDNLPLKQLLLNDKDLQQQIDSISNPDPGDDEGGLDTFGRGRFDDLRPYTKQMDPGKVFVKTGSFIGRNNRPLGYTHGNDGTNPKTGLNEKANSPSSEDHDTDLTNFSRANMTRTAARTSVFRFGGTAGVNIPAFDATEFESDGGTTAPLGRLDLVLLTTDDGAMDDGMTSPGSGHTDIMLVKGAGILYSDSSTWPRKESNFVYRTVGQAQEDMPARGHGLQINIQDNPEFGTVPAPDDVVNSAWTRNAISDTTHWAQGFGDGRHGRFGLPLAYVYVPQGYQEGQHIPPEHIIDIRPFFRTAELTLRERQAIAGSIQPGSENAFVTRTHLEDTLLTEVNRETAKPDIQTQIGDLETSITNINVDQEWFVSDRFFNSRSTDVWSRWVTIPTGKYIAYITYFTSFYGGSTSVYVNAASYHCTEDAANLPNDPYNNVGHKFINFRAIEPKNRQYGNGTHTSQMSTQVVSRERNDDDDSNGTAVIDFEINHGHDYGSQHLATVAIRLYLTGTVKSSTIDGITVHYQRIGDV